MEHSLTCPACKKEVARLRVQYECPNGHTWGEEVDRAVTATQPRREGRKMPFGKHKGELIEDLPVDYMRWCLENIDHLSEDLKEEFQNQIDLKSGKGVVRQEVKREGKKFTFGGK